jgi:hypothetical protein
MIFKRKTQLAVSIFCFVIALLIFLFGTGLRVIYSSSFFMILGIILIVRLTRNTG